MHVTDHAKKNDYLRKYAKVVFYEHFLSLELVVEEIGRAHV